MILPHISTAHPVDSGISPWDGGELYFDPQWEYLRTGEAGYKCVADRNGVVVFRSTGWLTSDDCAKFSEIVSDIIRKMGWDDRSWILFWDCASLIGMDISARGALINLLISLKQLRAVVVHSPSYLMKAMVELAVRRYSTRIIVTVSETWEQSIRKVGELMTVSETSSTEIEQQRVPKRIPESIVTIDDILTLLGAVEWAQPGVDLIENAAKNSTWAPFLKTIAFIKNDLDAMIVSREERLRDLQEHIDEETALQKKLSAALEESQKAKIVFDRESQRNHMLSQVVIDTQKETLFALGEIIESRSKETANHIRRVAEYSRLLAKFSGMSDRDQQVILHASPMHDAGKIAIPDRILNKPGKLDNDEFSIMKDHTRLGWNMLRSSPLEIMGHAATIAHQHHEKWNGGGYPAGLRGEQIHTFGRMVAVADVFDALASDRCYKKAWPLENVFELMQKERGEHFDPQLIDIFFEHLGDFLHIRERFPDAAV